MSAMSVRPNFKPRAVHRTMDGTYMYSDEYEELALDREHNVQQLTAITTNYSYNFTYNVKASISYSI